MAKEIIEITRKIGGEKGLVTYLHFSSEFDIPKKIKGVHQAEVTTEKFEDTDNTDISYYITDTNMTGAKKKISPNPILRREKYEEAVLAHFEAVNNIKKLYVKNPALMSEMLLISRISNHIQKS